jgi:hypothetical protein
MEVSGELHAPGTHWIGGWTDAVVKIKIPFLVSAGNGTPVVDFVT